MDSAKKNALHILIIRATPAPLAITRVEIAQEEQKKIAQVVMILPIYQIRHVMLVILAAGSVLTFQRIIAPNVGVLQKDG